jgi:hypothetical protein
VLPIQSRSGALDFHEIHGTRRRPQPRLTEHPDLLVHTRYDYSRIVAFSTCACRIKHLTPFAPSHMISSPREDSFPILLISSYQSKPFSFSSEGVLLVSYLDSKQSIFVFHPGPIWTSRPIRVHHSELVIIIRKVTPSLIARDLPPQPPPAIDNTTAPSKGIKPIHPSCSIRTPFDTTTISTSFRLTFAARCCNISHQFCASHRRW